MRFAPLLTPLCLILAFSGSAHSQDETSWGKANVSFDDYVRDSRECAETSNTVAVSIKPETLKQLDSLSSAALLDLAMQGSASPDSNPMKMASDIASQHSSDNIARRSNTFGEGTFR